MSEKTPHEHAKVLIDKVLDALKRKQPMEAVDLVANAIGPPPLPEHVQRGAERERTAAMGVVDTARRIASLVPESGPTTVYGHLPEWCALRAKLDKFDRAWGDPE